MTAHQSRARVLPTLYQLPAITVPPKRKKRTVSRRFTVRNRSIRGATSAYIPVSASFVTRATKSVITRADGLIAVSFVTYVSYLHDTFQDCGGFDGMVI